MTRKKTNLLFLSQLISLPEKEITANTVTACGKKQRLKRIKSWLKKIVATGILATATAVSVQSLWAVDINNGRTVKNYVVNSTQPNWNPNTQGGPTWSNGSAGSWEIDEIKLWFGLSNNNNVITALNQHTSGGTVNITNLDNTVRPATSYYNWYWTSTGISSGYWTSNTISVPAQGPYSDSRAHTSAFGGTVTINAGATTNLTANYSTSTTVPNNAQLVPLDQLFSITNTTIGFTKEGLGTLSIQTNTNISRFNGNSGTLRIDGTTGDQSHFARITSATVNLNGGIGTGGDGATNYIGQRAGFTFISGVADNKWDITQLNSTGFTTQGTVNVANTTNLNGTTTVDTNLGKLTINNITHVGSNAGTHIFNVVNNGVFTSTNSFTVGKTAAGSNSLLYLNVDNGRVTTGNTTNMGGTILGTQINDAINGVISGASSWTNHGNFIVAQNSADTKLSVESNSFLTSSGFISVGQNSGSNGTLNVSSSTVESTTGDIFVAQNDGATGTFNADNNATVNAAKNIDIALGIGSEGTLTADNGSIIRAIAGSITVAQGADSTGVLSSANGASVTAAADIDVAIGAGSQGTLTADGGGTNATITATDGHLTLAESGYGIMEVKAGGKVNIRDAGTGTPNAGNANFATAILGYGKGTVNGLGSELNVDQHLVVGKAGTGLLSVENEGNVKVHGNHIIADGESNGNLSFGRDVVSGNGKLTVDGDMLVGNKGNAGGRYDYIGVEYNGGGQHDPATWIGSDNLTATPKLPDGQPDPKWSGYVPINSPGLAIVEEGRVEVAKNLYAGEEETGYAYILLDNKGKPGDNILSVGENFLVADKGEAYLRIVNGSKVEVKQDMIVGNQGRNPGDFSTSGYKGHGTVRINGSDAGLQSAELNVTNDLIVGNKIGSEGYLYAHDSGKVIVGNDHYIGKETGSFGRDHFDGNNTNLQVTNTLHVGFEGTAGGHYEYRLDGSNADPDIWFDSHNLLLEPGDGDQTLVNNGVTVTKNWDTVKNNSPGLAITSGAHGDAQTIHAGIRQDSFSYILIDNKNSGMGQTTGLKAAEEMNIADAGESYVRVLNGGQLEVGSDVNGILTIAETTGQGTLRIGNTTNNTGTSHVSVIGTLITAGNGTNGDIAEGYLYANDGSTTQVIGTHIVAQGQYSFGREHFNGNGTKLIVKNDTALAISDSQTIIGGNGNAGERYRYILGGGNKNDPTIRRTEFSNNNNGKWFDSANLLLEPEQTAIGSNVNYPALTWDDVKNNSPGFALTAGATASVNDSIVANGSDSYGYVLLDNIDNDSPSATRTLWTTTGANNALILGNAGDAYARVINGSLLEVKGNMIVANEGTSEATIRINNTDGNNSAELTVSNNLTVANASGAEGNLYTYKAAKVTVGNSNTHSGDFTIAGGANSYGRVHFDGDQTIGTVGGMLTVGQGGHAGLSYIYTPHLQDSAGNFNNKINDPENWFDSINTLDDDISNSSQVTAGKNGYTINAGNISRTFIAAANNPLVKQHNAPGFLVSDGAKVTSGQGMVAAEIGSTGYAVIDNKGTHTGRSLWTINNDTLTIAEHGNAYVRVLNGALLNTTAAGGDVIIGDKNSSHGTLRVQDEGSQLAVKNDLVTGKNGTTGGQDNIAIGNFYLHNKAAAGIEGIHTIAEGIYSEGRDHIDGDGTELNINGTLTVGESGYAGNYVYHVNDSNNAKDPTNNAAEFNQWFDSANTLKDFHDSTNIGTLKENMPGLAVTAGAKVISGNGMVAKEAVTNTPTIPAEAADNLFRSNGYFVIDNAGTTAGRSEWKIIAGLGIPASAGDLIVAQEGTGYGRVINGALLDVENDMIIAERSDNGGTGRARSVGTVRVYDKDNRYDSTLNVGHNLTTAQEGTGSLYIYQGADGNVKGDHTVAELQGSYGNDHFDGHNTKLTVGGMLTVGNFGQAGGRYDYIGNGKAGGINGDPATWFDSDNTLLTQGDTGWDAVKKNTPGLAITAGAEAASGGGVVGKNRNINDGTQSYGYVVIDSKGKSVETDRSKWIVQTNNLSSNPSDNNILTVAKNGEGYVRVINGSLLEVGTKNGSGGNGTMLIGSDSYGYGTVRVNSIDPENGTRSELIVHGNLTTGGNGTNIDDYATGNLYAHDQARIQVDNNHVIAAGQYSVGRDHIDGVGTTMNVERTLTVGESGAAGGLYQENRYNIPANKDRLDVQHYYVTDPTALRDPERWLDHEARTLENLDRTLQNLGNPENAKTGNVTGNSPGLAITAGAVVTSGNGMVAQNSTANGYVLIDDKRVGADSNDDSVRTRWVVQNDGTPLGTEGQLVIGGAGNAFVRVLNGSLLQSDSTVIAQNSNEKKQGYLYVIGGKENPKDADGNPIARTDALTGKPTTWLPSEWFSKGRTVIGQEIGNERGTLRIEEGAHGVTCGLYIGLSENSQGEVSVSGTSASPHDHANATRSLLEVYEDTSPLKGSIPQGSSTLSVSDYGYLWMHQNSELRLNGVGIISNGAILHLSEDKIKLPYYSETNSPVHPLAAPNFITDPAGIFTNTPILQNQRTALVDAMESKITIVNARIEGDGTVTGEDGVFIAYDQEHDITNTQTTVDPGQRYDWNNRDEYFSYYGTLKFGDQLRMRGDVVTNFDVNSGYYAGMGGAGDDVTPQEPNCDAIIVQRGDSSTSKADVLAQLNGTLNVHARLTDYYQQQNDLLVVQTIGDTKPGSILSVYDKLKVMPHRFFDDPHQEIRQDSRKNDQLWVTLKRKNNPFEESGNTYNEKETGKGLDSVYMDQVQSGRKDWLPVLRYFWYLDNPDFLNAYRLFSGEVRAHSLLLPMTNQWRYAHNRIDFRECNNVKHNHNKPCDETQGVSHEYLRCGAAKNQWKEHLHKLAKNARLWGSIVYDDMEINNDGNAADSRLHRYGIVAGADRPFLKPESYLGVMLSINRGKLNTFQAKAQDDDFSVSLYHGTKLFEKWEWKNYLGVGVQDYNMVRNVNVNLTNLEWRAEDHYFANNPLGNFGGSLTSDFLGYTFSGSTELARPFYFGNCGEYQFRPYMALDMAMVWQNSDSEIGDFINSGLVALDYLSATNIRVYGRPGFLLERNGRRTSLHAGLSYAFLMGGRQYTNVNNRFQIGGKTFNIRGVDDGAGFVTWNFGGNFYLGKQKNCSVIFDYWGSAGSHFITQSAQLGLQKKF